MIREWNITIPALTGEEQRKAYVYVPDSAYADAQRRYPVLYMFDGQNLFSDSEATYGKSWGLLDWLTEHNTPLIVAAAECSRHAETDECGGRLSEYSPFDFSGRWGDIKGRGELTMDWLIRDFKPYIDEHCPTLPDREHTFIAGSSMGGLMTLYALCAHGDVFSRGAALSPSLGFAHPKVRAMLREADLVGTALYMDNGSEEMRSARAKKLFAEAAELLILAGAHPEIRGVPGGVHNEASWERQIPFFMDVLFYNLP